MMSYTPRLFVGNRPTLACLCLRWCANPKGYVPPYFKSKWRPGAHIAACYALQKLGLVEIRHDGPRGGKRWHTTELGDRVLDIIDHSPTPRASLLLLGLPAEVIRRKEK